MSFSKRRGFSSYTGITLIARFFFILNRHFYPQGELISPHLRGEAPSR